MSDLNLFSFKSGNKLVFKIITNATEYKIDQIMKKYFLINLKALEIVLKRDNFLFFEIKKSDLKNKNDVESLYFKKITIEV